MCQGCQWGWKRLSGGKLGVLEGWAVGYRRTQRCVMDLGFPVRGGSRALPCGTDGDLGSAGSVLGVAEGQNRLRGVPVGLGGCGSSRDEPLERDILPFRPQFDFTSYQGVLFVLLMVLFLGGLVLAVILPYQYVSDQLGQTGPNWAGWGGAAPQKQVGTPRRDRRAEGHSLGWTMGTARGWNWPRAEDVSCCSWRWNHGILE